MQIEEQALGKNPGGRSRSVAHDTPLWFYTLDLSGWIFEVVCGCVRTHNGASYYFGTKL